jgi:hypothetical protein
MFKKLLIVAVSAAMLALVSIGAAIAVGGPEIQMALEDGEFEWTAEMEDYDGPIGTKDFVFDSTRELTIEVPVEMRFERSDTVSMKVEGPQDAIDDLVYENGKLDLRGSGHRLGKGLKLTITAPKLTGLRLEAPGDVELVQLDQDAFEIHSEGAADVNASGRVGSLTLVADGAADFDFEEVSAKDATIEINGAGDIDISATGSVAIEINGAGSVTLHAKPTNLKSEINGIGSVDHSY